MALRLRRQDLRLLVGCGAGGAIAAAFGAPLTGAFYASELIIGAYSLAIAGPIFAAALAATLTTKALLGAPYVIVAPPVAALTFGASLSSWSALGLISAALGVGAMRAAALLERGFAATRAPRWARPALGGLVLAAMALYTPQVLGAGHGAIGLDFYGAAFRRDLGDAARAEAEREPDFARVGLSRRPVLRLAVRRRAARQALCDRRRRRVADARARPDRLHHGGHGRR